MSVELLVAGVISLDTSLHVPFIPARDSECFVSSIREMHGGSAANVAAFCALYGGLSVGLIARIGDDPLGEILLDRIFQYNVNHEGILRTPGMSSTRIFSILPPDDSHTYMINLGAHLALSRRDIPSGYSSSARAFYLAPCSPEIHADLLDFATSKGWIIYFNPGTVYIEQAEKKRLLSLIAKSHFLFLNEMEALAYSSKDSMLQAGKFLLDCGPSHVVVTASDQGSYLFSAGNEEPLSVSSKRVNVVNTIGAGDAFAAGFISEHLNTGEISSALLNGAIFSSFAITQEELRAANPSPLAIKQFASIYNQL